MRFKLLTETGKLHIDKDTLYDLYITQQMTSNEVASVLGCSSKTVRNYLSKYEIPIRPMPDAVKLERSKWSDEKELERSRNVHNAWASKSPDEIKAIQAKKMASGNINSPDAIAKAHATRLANGTSKESSAENVFYNKLLLMGFDRDDVIRHYHSDSRYPFDCDFYIKSKDMFIEYQGHQTHGPEPFDSKNNQHIDYLNKCRSRGVDMSTWVKRDPHKLEVAEKNNITLLLVYPKNKVYLLKNGTIATIDINDINKI